MDSYEAVRVYPDRRVIVVPARADLPQLMPSTKTFQVRGRNFMALPHTPDTTRLLRNLDIAAPEPIRHYYGWAGTTPFATQIDTAALMTTYRRAFVLNSIGTGKTRSTLYAFDFLRSVGQARKLCVVAPLSTLVTVWENEIFANFPHLTAVVVHGPAAKRRKLLAGPADVYIINHDGVEVVGNELRALSPDVVALDELAIYRNPSTARWRSVRPLVRAATWAWGLTGAPTPNEPTDAYGQVKLLRPENVGFSFRAFREATMRQVTQFRWIPRPEANEYVHKVMQPSIRITRDQCVDLPPTTYSTRSVPLDPRAAPVYKEMFDKLAVEHQAKTITAANEGVKLSKLLQISSGFAYDDDSEASYVGAKERIREVFNIVEAADRKVIVYAPFRYLARLLHAALSKRWSTALVIGDVGRAERDLIFANFQRNDDPRVLVSHPATSSHGLTLTKADTIIWAAPTMSAEIYEQANGRITRPGQNAHTHIVHIQSTRAESLVYDRLRRREKMQGALLSMFEN